MIEEAVAVTILDYDNVDEYLNGVKEVESTMVNWNNNYPNYTYTILKDSTKFTIQVEIYAIYSTEGNPQFSEGDGTGAEFTSELSNGNCKFSI